jgi:type IX secretion system PorP/SprF family membrane protein
VAGTDNDFKARMNNRFQWLNFADAPITNQLSAYGPHKNLPIGYGGTVGYDAAGASSRFNLNGAFAFNFALSGNLRLSTGLNFGLIQYRVDGAQLRLDSPNDPARQEDPYAPAGMMSALAPDAAAGLWLYTENLYIGFSALQLFNYNLKFNGLDSKNNRHKIHYNATAGYRLHLGNWMVEPALQVRQVEAVPTQFDLTARVMYLGKVWLGANARSTFEEFNDVSFMVGYIHNNRLNIGVAYDLTSSRIRPYTNGTVELMIGYNFDDVKNRTKSSV